MAALKIGSKVTFWMQCQIVTATYGACLKALQFAEAFATANKYFTLIVWSGPKYCFAKKLHHNRLSCEILSLKCQFDFV